MSVAATTEDTSTVPPASTVDVDDSLSLVPAPGAGNDPYGEGVRDNEEIDRAAWAKLLTELLDSAGMTPEQAGYTPPRPGQGPPRSGPVTTNWRTLRRWLNQEHGVSAKSVRDTCRELGYPPIDGLVRVGFLTADEARMGRLPVTAAPPLPKELRQIVDVLASDRFPDTSKRQLRRALDAAYDVWRGMDRLRAPRERPAPERLAQGNGDQ